MVDSKHVTSLKERVGGLANDVKDQLEAMHVGMRAGDQAAIDAASDRIKEHIHELRVIADTVLESGPEFVGA